MDAYLRQWWFDERLAFDETKIGDNETDEIIIRRKIDETFWVPDTVFLNQKEAKLQESTVPSDVMKIKHTGEVYRMMRSVN